MLAMSLLGIGPSAMKRAVMMPQAMNAGMFGMTMFERKVPKRCTWTRAPPGFLVVVSDAVVIMVPRLFLVWWGLLPRWRLAPHPGLRPRRRRPGRSRPGAWPGRACAAAATAGRRRWPPATSRGCRAEANQHDREQRVGRGLAADPDRLACGGPRAADLADEAEHGRVPRALIRRDRTEETVGRERVLGEIVGADRGEGRLAQHAVGQQGRRRDLDHDAGGLETVF